MNIWLDFEIGLKSETCKNVTASVTNKYKEKNSISLISLVSDSFCLPSTYFSIVFIKQ